MTETSSKRKRSANTSDEQYEEYLWEMENDYIFRRGTNNPTVNDDYLNNKWDALANKLNSVDNGPVLSKEVWKKRFNDWKNSIRSKQRKIQEQALKTGGGSQCTLKLTPLEERGINVWGKVAVTGTNQVVVTGGLPLPEVLVTGGLPHPVTNDFVDIAEINCGEKNESTSSTTFLEKDQPESPGGHVNHILTEPPIELRNKSNPTKKAPLKRGQKQIKPLNEETLMGTYKDGLNINQELNQTLKHLGDLYKECEDKKLELETRKLAFEIAKYKFEHEEFQFN